MFDLIIIGAGPAGTAAALTAATFGVSPERILLLEQGRFPRDKVCGEFVSGEALGLLASLLEDDAVLVERALRIERARLFFGERHVEFALPTAAASIPRYNLDSALWHAAKRRGIHCRSQARVLQLLRNGGTFAVHTPIEVFDTRSVIDAAGRWSKLQAQANARPANGGDWIGLKAHFHSRANPSTDLYFFDGGYCGVQPVSADKVNVCAMVRGDRAVRLEQVFALHPLLHRRSRAWTQATDTVATAPLRFLSPKAVRRDVLCAGDAAGFIDPFAGEGISLALRSGELAGAALARFCRGEITLTAAVGQYAGQYHGRLLPAFRNAARARALLDAQLGRRLALLLMRVPAVARLLLKATR
ncbi:MAG: NAD(P)/FAD-dependent oxidoreductase [Terriglobales bacterium]